MRDLLRYAPRINGHPTCSCFISCPAAPALWPALPSTVTPRYFFFYSTVPPRCFLPLLLLCSLLCLTARTPPHPRMATTPSIANLPLRPPRKEKRRALARKPFDLASCNGCGTPMQLAKEAPQRYDACSSIYFY
jgi:hypothetical protein